MFAEVSEIKVIPSSKDDLYRELPPLKEFRIRWPVLIAYAVIHLGAFAAPFFFTWEALFVGVGLWVLTGMLGISAGYHRLLAHKAYETHRWVRNIHATFGALALQLGPITWSRLHRIHHAKSDTIEDPHTQQFGFWYGHMGWSVLAHAVIGRSSLLKLELKDLTNDWYLRFLDRYYLHLVLASLVVLFLVGGWPYLFWAGFARIAFLLHTTWLVNSVGHRWGYRNFNTKDTSVNQPLLAIFGWGEGWHNNHHRFPSSSQFGLKRFEFDITWQWLKLLKVCGLIWNVKTPASYAPPANGPSH